MRFTTSDSKLTGRHGHGPVARRRPRFLQWPILAILCVLLSPTSADAQSVQLANSWTTGSTHSVGAGSNRLLVYVITIETAGADVTSVTYGGQSMTQAVEDQYTSGDSNRVEIWYLNEAGIQAASGNTFNPSFDGGDVDVELYSAVTFANVDQTTPIVATASTNGTNATLTTGSFSVLSGGMAVSGTSHEGGGSYTDAAWGSGWSEGTDQATGTTQGTGYTSSAYGADGTDTATATHSSSGRHAIVAASIAPSGTTQVISGTVFEDVNFTGTASDYDGGVNDLPLPNVDVELYSNTDTYISSTTTDGSGNFSFAVADNTYKVRVRSATIGDSNTAPAGTFNGACGITDPASGAGCVLPELAWANGAAAYGGQSETVDDTATNNDAGPGDTWSSVTVSGADVPNVNFGFAYNLIVNTNNSGQGSLDNFIDNANAIGSTAGTTANSSEFRIPATDPNFAAGVARITPTVALPTLTDAGTTIDGTTQTSNNGDTNAAVFGTGGNVGVAALPLSTVAGPEIEIRDGASLANGIQIQANNVTIRGLAMLGFGAANEEGAIVIDAGFTGALVEDNVLGSTATSFTDPGAALRNYAGVVANGGDNGTVQDNLFGFGHRGVFLLNGADDWSISGNEVVDHDIDSTDGDGIAISSGTNNTITGNLITGSSSQGFVVTNGVSANFVNNTLTGNGVGSTAAVAQSAAITMRSTASSTTIDRNIVHDNYGAGIQVNDGATGTVITQNSFAGNGTVAARSTAAVTDQIGIDLNVSGDNNNLGTPDYFSVNDQADTLQDFPILDTATISGGNLTLTGWSKANATIEVFIAAPDPHGFGEGETFIGTFVEGVLDADPATSDYSGLINGIDQGADVNASRFSFTVPVPAGVSDGTQLTATATLSGETSEFSGLVTASVAHEISGRIFEDLDSDGLPGAQSIGDASNPALENVDVYLYLNNGLARNPDATDTLVASTTTAADGSYAFTGLPTEDYFVFVDSKTVEPTAGYQGAYVQTDVWAEQSYGPGGRLYNNAGWAEINPGGLHAGGARADVSDDASDIVTAEHISYHDMAGGVDDTDVDYGFSFNVVTTTRGGNADDDDGGATGRTVQGSLRQFIDNANAIPGANTMLFAPRADTNASAGASDWWRIDLTVPLPSIDDASTTIDGTARWWQNTTLRNTNDANQGAGETVGVDGLFTTPVLDPELEIDITGFTPGLLIDASNSVLRNVSIWGSDNFDVVVGNDAGGDVTGVTIEQNILGTPPHQFDGSFAPSGNDHISLESEAKNGTVQNNLMGFGDGGSVTIDHSATGWLVFQNELRHGGRAAGWGVLQDGVGDGASGLIVRGNLLVDLAGFGVDTYGGVGGINVEQNTFRGNGRIAPELGGIRLMGSTGSTVTRNIFEQNNGPAIIVVSDRPAAPYPASERNHITQNAFSDLGGGDDNAAIAIDLLDSDALDAEHDDGEGISPNDGALDANAGNNGLDYPVIDGAFIAGGNLTVTGFARPGVEIEFYEAIGAANDNNASGDPHGEGAVYLFASTEGAADADATTGASYTDPGYGSDPNVNRFSFTVATPAGLVIGDEISPIAYLAANGTSEFGPNFTVTGPVVSISGTVFEDTAGNVLNGAESIGDLNNPTLNGVDIRLYNDDGATANQPDATDTLRAGPVATAGAGAYSFASVPDGTYWVVVDSRTLSPSAGVHPSYLATTPWAEQTYGPDKGWCADGSGGTAERTGSGPCYGGVDGASDDDVAALTSSEHVARVVVAGGAVSNIDFGFSYNVVTNTVAAGDASLTASTYQGSIDQFVRNANSINGANAMRFVPAVPTNAAGGGGAWWRINYTGSIAGETITNTHDADTSINGTAYDLADGVTVRNTNTGNLGANAFGGVTVGVGGVSLPQVARPELEVMRSDPAVGVAFYFYSNGSTGQIPDNFAVRDVATWGFVGGVGMTGIAGLRPTGVVIERNVIGSAPNSFSDPAVPGTLRGVSLLSTDSAAVRDNLIGFVDTNGVSVSGVTATTVSGNEIRDTGQVDGVADGINYGGTSTTGTITANLIVDSGGMGIDGTSTGNLVENNTVTGSGQRGVQIAGIRQTGSANTVRRNIITGSAGPGVIVPDTVNAIEVTENQFGTNGLIAIDVVEAGGDTATGDGITLNDGAVNAADGNDGLDYPVIDSAVLSGGNLTVTGFARAGVTIEFYEAVGAANDNNSAGNPHGEGVSFLFSAIEGMADADATTGASYTDPGYGADANVNRFSFTVAAPAGLVAGEEISPIAYLAANGTSEFGPNAVVSVDADLVTTKVLDPSTPGPFAEGDSITYLLTVTNNGPAQATNVTATDTYPSQLTLGAPVPSAPTTYAAGTGIWTIGTLNSGASATLQLPGTVNAGTAGDVVTNSVTAASGDQSDPTAVGDDLDESFTVLPFLSIDDIAQAETDSGTTTFTFTVSIDQVVGYDVTFDFDTADDTATVADSDYVAITGGSGTITNGSTSTTINVTVNGDNQIEADETFFVNLSNVVGAAVSDAQGQGTISNDDSATVSIAATADANESGPVNGQFTVTQSATSETDTVVSYSIAGTATAGGTDYATLSGSVTILAGDTTATIDVTGINVDALVEGNETVIVTLTGTDNPGITVAAGPADTATVNILDANAATVSIAAITDANESGPVNGQFTVTQSATSATDTVVSYSIAGTATAGGTDYATLSGSVTVLAGDTTATIDVTGINVDALIEGNETVIVTLTGTDNPGITVAASPADTATVNILDANSANVSIAATTDANEAGPADGLFTVTQTATSATDTVITYNVGGTATAGGTDYATLGGSVTVLAGDTTATIDVTGINVDALIEGNETVIVTLTGTDNPGITVAASPADTATVNILDANSANVSIAATTDANEAGPADGLFTVTQTATSATDTVITYNVGGTATAGGTDYATLGGSITILAGDTTATIDVTGINVDALVEGNETVIVTLTGTDNPGITVAASPADTATVNILDANAATVSVSSIVDANEAGPVDGQFMVTQSATSATDTVISYTVAGTATAGGTDYTTLSGSVTVLAGDTAATIDVTGINVDTLVEGTETVVVTLTGTDNPGITVAASPADAATISIIDADTANVSIASITDANEAGPADGQFTITQSITSASDTVVSYTVAGTATAGGTDYATLSGSVTVLAGDTTATIDVTGIVVDTLVEGNETVIVTLTGTDNPGIAVAASPADTATVNVLDANSASVSIAATTDANEAGPVDGLFTVTQTATSATDTVITYNVGGTATAGGTDYATLSGSVTVLAGDTTTTIDVTGIVADALVEGTETVIVTLTGTDNPGITVAASPADTATLSIIDANTANVSIAATTDGSEAGPTDGQFTVTQSVSSVTDTVISYSVAGTATAGGTDYTTLSGSVTILAGDTTATIDVTGIIADALVEGPETVIVTLTGTDNPGITVAASPADTATVDILDSSTANVGVASIVDANEAGPVDGQFMVTQSATSASDTVVSYTVAGTATATTDYLALSGSVTILAGDTAATIDVTGIVADALVEGAETVIVTLTGTDNPGITVAPGPADTATVNILDANGATVSVAATTDANEAGPVNGQFTVTQSATSASDTVISYTVAGTATAGGTDYTTLSGSVTLLAGDTTATIDVTGIVADALVEGNETVIVTLTGTDNLGITVAPGPADTATVNILDNNGATVSVAATTNANEAGPVNGQFTVTQSATSASDTVISYTVAGTATAGGTDYASLSGNVTVLAGSTTATIDVTGIVADALVEGNETVIVTLTGTDNPGITVAPGPADTATVNILDNSAADVSIAATVDANETGPVDGRFTVTQSATSESDTIVTYVVSGTATASGTDYASLSGSVTVAAGATTATIDVTGIVADALVEGTETVIVTLTGTDNPGITVAASPADTAIVNILDSSNATVGIATITDANEAGPVDGQFMVTQSTASASDTVVTYTVAGTATATTDYAALSGSVTILAGDTAATIDVTGIVADALVEGTETVIVTLTGTDNPGVAVDASPDDTATVNILDNNGATVSIAATTDADEAGPVDGQFTITQSATSASDTVISYTVAGTATAGGTDYATLSGSVTVLAGATTATIDVTGIVADALIEGDETVIVTLTATDNVAITVAASPADTATVNILDDAAATVSIAPTTNGAESGPVDGLFTLTQSATAINDTVISYVVAGTATSGSDYTALSGTVTIPAGATTATIIIPVIDDAVAEGVAETVDVTLSSITSSDPGISIAASPLDVASITIVDNDSDLITTKTVSNAVPQEGGSITYTITVTNSTGVQATNVSLTDTLPSGVTYVSDDGGGAYDSASGLWSIGTVDTVAPNNVATLNITATVDAGASSLAQPIINTTTAAVGDQPDPDTSTDTLTAGISVDANADLVTTKTVDNAAPVENSTIVYTISVLNNGAAQATNVSLVDSLPTGVSYVSDDSGGTYNAVTGVWAIGTLDDGAVANLNITATVDTGAGTLPQPISNVTTAAAGDQPDPDTTTDGLAADITVNYTANLVTTKTVDVASPQAGNTIVYTLTTTNNGPAPATNVSLTDSLPAGVTYVGDDSAGAYVNATGVWTIGDLANGAVATLNITATVDSGAAFLPQPITNTATVASADQVDPDATGDDLSADIIVNLIDPNLVQLNKTAGRNRANAGEIVSYSIEIRNTGVNPIAAVRVSDSPARGFKYVPGTAQLDGVPISDPAGGFPLAFDIGVLPGLVDSDGNGVADPGEPGYAVLSYRMVAGSGVAPGIWTNTAIATATCDTCFVSNIASADIEIIEDTLFDLGTIIGKVFYDGDRDGFQDSGEGGIEAAMVALDDGTYALTDEFGRYHFPAVKPGQRLLKINLNSLAGKASATNSKTRIVNVTPGLLAKANFGVIVETVDAAIGEDGQYGIGVDSKTIHPPVLINGSSLAPSLLVNGEPVSLASADVRLGSQKIADVVELDNGRLATPIRFTTRTSAESAIKRWKLIVKGSGDEVVRTWKGKGAPPEFIEWDGTARRGKLISSGAIYTYYLELDTSDGQSISSSHRLFGVNRRNSISLNLAGGAFVSASHELTTRAKKLLSQTATAIRAYPDEMIVISGHTDSVGSDESNIALAERRARSAFDYLIKVEGLPEEQFVIQAFGESQPIAGNDTAWGRELNRRVEISGDLSSVDRARNYDPYRRPPTVQINASDIDLDDAGTFRTKVDMESTQESMKVLLTTSQGRSVETTVTLPTLHVIAPQGRVAIPIDSDRAGPDILDADNNTLLLHTELLGRTEPGNTVEFNGEALDVDDNGLFMARLPLRTGENYYGLVARNPMGMLRIANLKLTLEKSSIDAPEFVVEPVPQLALQLPPPGIPMTHANLVIPGRTVPGNRVFINDRPVDVDAEGHFTATVELERGENPFTAKVVDQDGHSGQIEQSFEYNGEPMFFMALVDGKISQLETSGNLAAAGKTKSKETVTEGRVAYYLKGHVLGKYLLTSAFDSGRQEMGEVFSDLTAQDNDRLLTNLDPDTLYPVYGDNSTLVYDAQSQSKFYLALESETVTALIGNYALNFTDTELAGYQRTLYGASATYQSEAKDEDGRSRTKVQAFHAKIEQAHVRDELRATGGSLYYLSARNVIEGSEHISVIVRDQDSGLILRRTALQQGLDYSIDYVDGRLLTNRPISSFTADYSLIESDLLGGSAVYLQIDYETALDGFEQTASGARVRQGVGERLAVGATAVDEDQLGSQYSLKAADAEYKVGKNSRLIAEFATSEGNNSLVNVSEDGGLTYQAVPQAADSSGDAYKIAAEIDAGEWFGFEDRVLLNTYFKRLDPGFSANSVTSEQGSEKSGFAANWKISDDSSLLGRHEKQVNLLDGSENTLSTMQWNLLRDQWGLAAEVEDRQGFSGDATFAALRVNYRWTQALSTSLLHQQTLAGIDNDQSTVGVAYRATEKLTLDASATHGTKGDSAQIGAQLDWRGNRFYVAQRLSDLEESGLSNNRLVGMEAPFGSDGAVYSEYHWNRLPDGRQRQAMLGARQRFHASDVLRIEISGEHSAENATSNNTGERYAVSIGAIYDNDNGITFSTRNEYRKDSRSIASEQFLSTSNMQFALGDDLSMIGKYRFSKSESSAQLDRNIDFTEASFGLAYRPVAHDRLNLLTRITRLTNTPTEFQLLTPVSGTTSDIFAVDWSYQVTQGIEWVGKQAMRWTESDDDPLELRSLTSLSIQRLNWSMPKKLLLGTEYRIMRQDIADDQRQGFVTELMWEGLDPVILGVGYNFSDVSDNEYVDYDFSTKGPFFRLQGKF